MASTSSSRRRSASSNGATTEVSRSLAKPSAALPRTPDVREHISEFQNTGFFFQVMKRFKQKMAAGAKTAEVTLYI